MQRQTRAFVVYTLVIIYTKLSFCHAIARSRDCAEYCGTVFEPLKMGTRRDTACNPHPAQASWLLCILWTPRPPLSERYVRHSKLCVPQVYATKDFGRVRVGRLDATHCGDRLGPRSRVGLTGAIGRMQPSRACFQHSTQCTSRMTPHPAGIFVRSDIVIYCGRKRTF